MLAGEPFTDHPASVCPVIGSFLRAYNDSVDDGRRQDLYEYASKVVGSRTLRRDPAGASRVADRVGRAVSAQPAGPGSWCPRGCAHRPAAQALARLGRHARRARDHQAQRRDARRGPRGDRRAALDRCRRDDARVSRGCIAARTRTLDARRLTGFARPRPDNGIGPVRHETMRQQAICDEPIMPDPRARPRACTTALTGARLDAARSRDCVAGTIHLPAGPWTPPEQFDDMRFGIGPADPRRAGCRAGSASRGGSAPSCSATATC